MSGEPINLFDAHWEEERDGPEGFRARRVYVARTLGAEQLGASLWEIDPGESNMPYHAHHANEELLVVLAGTPTLRTAEGERDLRPGDTVLFARGVAHQLVNRSDGPARFLLTAPLNHPEIMELPDTARLGVFAGRPTSGKGEFTLAELVDSEGVDQRFFAAEPVDRLERSPDSG